MSTARYIDLCICGHPFGGHYESENAPLKKGCDYTPCVVNNTCREFTETGLLTEEDFWKEFND